MSCVFCKIVAGQIPSKRVMETEDAIVFLDINPVNAGHLLIVPREHHTDLSELSDDVAGRVATLLPRLARALTKATGADGLNVIINNGRAAGQTVFHGHWHLIPRFLDDAVNWPWPHAEYVGDELAQMQFRIQRELDPSAVEE